MNTGLLVAAGAARADVVFRQERRAAARRPAPAPLWLAAARRPAPAPLWLAAAAAAAAGCGGQVVFTPGSDAANRPPDAAVPSLDGGPDGGAGGDGGGEAGAGGANPCGGASALLGVGATCGPCRIVACAGPDATRCAYNPGPACPAFTNATASAGLSAPFNSLREDSGPGVGVLDVNDDGALDLVHAGRETPVVYLADAPGAATFTRLSSAGALDAAPSGNGVVPVDLDADGRLDLALTSPPVLRSFSVWRSLGDGTFADAAVGPAAELEKGGNGMAWADYDGDGDLDVYVATFSQMDASHLLRNDDGVLVDVTDAAGVELTGARSFEPAWLDYDLDGDQDLLVSNDIPFFTGVPMTLFRNEGDGTFIDASLPAGAGWEIDGMGIAIGDPDGDGDPDVYVTNVAGVPLAGINNILMMNQGDGTFLEESRARGADQVRWGWGTTFFDFDNDGDEDLFYADEPRSPVPLSGCVLLRNDGGGYFSDVSVEAGADVQFATFAAEAVDIDGDGDLDLLLTGRANAPPLTLLLNNGTPGRWLEVELLDHGANRFGIGATVRAGAGGAVQTRWVRAGDSIQGGVPPVAHFGMGWAPRADFVEVRWPDGGVTTVYGVPLDQRVVVTR